MTSFTFIVSESFHGMRLDQFLAAQVPGSSRAQCKQLIDAGVVLLNRKSTTKPGKTVQNNDVIIVTTTTLTPRPAISGADTKRIAQYLVAEHEHFLVLNKPAGLVVHPPSHAHTEIALTDLLTAAYPHIASIGQPDRPGIVHRLDKYTSGLLLVAQTPHGYETLITLFKKRAIQKTYFALVAGHAPATGTITNNIMRDPFDPRRMICHDFEGRVARTTFEAITYYQNCTLIKAMPKTGRTHQIRLHCAHIGHPVLGDALYGTATNGLDRYALHAHTLEFVSDGTPYTFTVPIPPDLTQFIEALPLKK